MFRSQPTRSDPYEGGQSLLITARGLAAALVDGVEQARRVAEGRSGVLTIGFPASLVSTRLPAMIRAFRSSHPDVTLRLRELTTNAQLEALVQKQIDLGFMREKEGGPSLVSKAVFREHLIALVPREHRLAKTTNIRLRQFAEEPSCSSLGKLGPNFTIA